MVFADHTSVQLVRELRLSVLCSAPTGEQATHNMLHGTQLPKSMYVGEPGDPAESVARVQTLHFGVRNGDYKPATPRLCGVHAAPAHLDIHLSACMPPVARSVNVG